MYVLHIADQFNQQQFCFFGTNSGKIYTYVDFMCHFWRSSSLFEEKHFSTGVWPVDLRLQLLSSSATSCFQGSDELLSSGLGSEHG